MGRQDTVEGLVAIDPEIRQLIRTLREEAQGHLAEAEHLHGEVERLRAENARLTRTHNEVEDELSRLRCSQAGCVVSSRFGDNPNGQCDCVPFTGERVDAKRHIKLHKVLQAYRRLLHRY